MEKIENDNSVKDEDILDEMKERFKFCTSYFSDLHEQMVEDQKFYHGDQWDEQTIILRTSQGKTFETFNQIKKYVSKVTQDVKDNTPSIKFKSSNSKNKKTTQVYSALVEEIEQKNMAREIYTQAVTNACICGLGGFYLKLDYDNNINFKKQLKMFPIEDPFSFFFDPNMGGSLRNMEYAFIIKRMTKEEFEVRYPDSEIINDRYFGFINSDWINEDEVRVVEYFYKKYKKTRLFLMNDDVILSEKDFKTSDYKNSDIISKRVVSTPKVVHIISNGEEILESSELDVSYIPVVPVFGEKTNYEGKMHFEGMVRQLKDAQFEYNFFSNVAIEMGAKMVSGKIIVPAGVMENFGDDYYDIYQSNNPVLKTNTDLDGNTIMPQFLQQQMDLQSVLMTLQAIQEKMNSITAIYEPALGVGNTNEASGYAISLKQNQSRLSNYKYIDNLNNSLIYTGNIIIEHIPFLIDENTNVNIKDESTKEEENVIISEDDDIDFSDKDFNVYVNIGNFDETEKQESIKMILSLATAMPEAILPLVADVIAKNAEFLGSDVLEDRFKKYLLPQELRDGAEFEIPAEVQQQIDAMMNEKDMQLAELANQLQQLSIALENAQILNSNLTSELNIERQEASKEVIKQEYNLKEKQADRAFKSADMLIKAGINPDDNRVQYFLSMAFDVDLNSIVSKPAVNERVIIPGINDALTNEQKEQVIQQEKQDELDTIDETQLDSIIEAMNISNQTADVPEVAAENIPIRTSTGNK